MTIFNVRYTPNGINVYNYDYDYNCLSMFYTKQEIEKKRCVKRLHEIHEKEKR